jgi:penicillin amidase
MTTRARRLVGSIVFILAALVVIVALTVWLALSGSKARLDGALTVSGPAAAIELSRDAQGTLTVEGRDRRDVAWGLGFAHAQERYFQMDLMRRVAAGELAALVGPAAIDTDRGHRVHRLRAVAERAYGQLPADQRGLLDAYRDGVNAGLAGLQVRPWEYLLLRAKPEPWRSEDSLLVVAAMYLDLNGDGRNERERRFAQMRAALPGPVVDMLLSPDGRWEAPLQGATAPAPTLPPASVFDLRSNVVAAMPGAPVGETVHPGSNNFAVAGKHTGNGAAIVANDMHLGLRVPNIWFRARMRYPDPSAPGGTRDLNGVTLPGTPTLVAGSNGQIAWAFTNSYGDWLDWVRVQRDPADATRYRTVDGWAGIEAHDEIIAVHGGAAQTLRVEDTRWGPIMGKDADGTPLALAWIAQLPRAYNLRLSEMEQVSDVHTALDLAPRIGIPPQNFVVGDAQGHIGWTLAGNTVPLRAGYDPSLPADWSLPDTGWIDFAPPSAYPRVEDPADGRLWTANNRTVGDQALALLGNGGHDLGARAQQIRDDLRARERFEPADLLAVQLDDRAVFLTRWQQLLQTTLAASDDAHLRQLRELTAHWSDRAGVDSVDYRLVREFRQHVRDAVLAPFVARVKARFPDFAWGDTGTAEAAVWAMLQAKPANLLDPRYANWDALLTASAKQVADDFAGKPGGMAAQTWGDANLAHIVHPLSAALPRALAAYLDMPAEPLPGDRDMPRVQAPSFGASERFGIVPGHEDISYLHMPGGQSDHPLSPFHGAGHDAWVAGKPTPLLPGPTVHRLKLKPRHPEHSARP